VKRNDRAIGLQDLVEGFLFSLQAEGRSNLTHKYYEGPLRYFLWYSKNQRWPGRTDLLNSKHVRQFLAWAGSRQFEYTASNGSRKCVKAKLSTAWRYYRAVRRLFNFAVGEGFLEKSPVKDIHFKPPPPPLIQPYSKEELKRFLAVCELDIRTGTPFIGLRNRAILLLLVDTALRASELAQLGLTDLNLEQKWVRVIGKGSKVGICPFSAKTTKALWAYLVERKRRAKCAALWVSEEGRPLTVEGLSSLFARLKMRAGVNGPGRMHRLRHASALQYLRATHDTFLLQLFLRHEDLTMSRRYTQGLKQEEAIEAHRNGASPVEGLGLG